MRGLLERLRGAIDAFVEQRDDLILTVACRADDAPVVLKLIRDAEQASASDIFLLFADRFTDAAAFVNAAVDRLAEEHRMACEALAEEGREALPPLPAALRDPKRPPAERLREAIDFARSLLPAGGGHRLVWAMFPLEIADRRAYLDLIASLVPRRGIAPWMRGVRVIVRDEDAAPPFAHPLTGAPRVRSIAADFSPSAIEADMARDVEDEGQPLEQRMQALLMLASIDAAHGRTAAATARYDVLLGHAQQTRNPTMQAIVLIGHGDLERRQGNREKAQHWYECAVPPAVEAQAPVLLATLSKNLGEISYERRQFAEAEQYFDGWDRLAGHMLDVESKARALEWRGLSQQQQGAHDRAIESWEAAATLSRNVGLPPFLRINLEHIRDACRQLRRRERLAEVEAELADLRRQEAQP